MVFKYAWPFTSILLFVLLLTGCDNPEKSREQSAQKIILFPFNTTKPIEAETVKYTARLLYFDNSIEDISTQTTWKSSDTNVATVDVNGTVTLKGIGFTTISAIYNLGESLFEQESVLTVKDNLLKSITIEPGSVSVARGSTQRFRAFGLFNEGQRYNITKLVTWQSSHPEVATLTKGLLYMKAESNATVDINATTTITASLLTKSEAVVLTIGKAELKKIAINYTPAQVGDGEITFEANGTMSDGTYRDVTKDVKWSSGNKKVLEFSFLVRPNVAKIVDSGEANITAKKDLLSLVKTTVLVKVTP